MKTLIVKLNATGDVLRTTCLLSRICGSITWITARENVVLLCGLSDALQCLSWEERGRCVDSNYDLVVNLEDDLSVATFVKGVRCKHLFGACLNSAGEVRYSEDARGWFDMSLISVYGRQRADELKLLNRRTYQDLIFEGLGFRFDGEPYLLPNPVRSDLHGDVAIAPRAGPVWPMKNWAYYDQLKRELEASGLVVNVLPHRETLLEHLGDVKSHRCLVCGDSLPMHVALGVRTPCVTLFNCTSPWEIYDYGLQTKIVSPLLGEFFYKRDFDQRATTAISVEAVLQAVLSRLFSSALPIRQSLRFGDRR